MDETIELFILPGVMVLFIITTWIIGWKLYKYRILRWENAMGSAERKRWKRFTKYRDSLFGGEKRGLLIMAGVFVIFVIVLLVVISLHSFRKAMLLWPIIFTPMLILMARYAFKTRNRDGIIVFSLTVIMLAGMMLYGLGYDYGLYIMYMGVLVFLGWMYLTGYGEKEQIALFNNLITTTGGEIDSQLDGYSQRPFSKQSDVIKNKLKNSNFRKIADEFAKTMGKEFIFMDWKVGDSEAIFYPINTSPVIAQIYLVFYPPGKNKLSWIKLNSRGEIITFISKPDYNKIFGQVTYHILCRNIAEKFEQSFMEFAKGSEENKTNAIKILRGEANE